MHSRRDYPPERVFLIFLIVLPVILAFVFVLIYGVNVPRWDQWDQEVATIEKFYTGTLTPGDLFAQHNESRPAFPRVISIVLGLITGYNSLAESFLGLAISAISFLVIFLLYKKDQGTSDRSLLLFLPVAFFFFNPYLTVNYLFGIHFGHAIVILGFFLSVYFIDSDRTVNIPFLAALVAAVIASFSFVAGLTIWPACFFQILPERSEWRPMRLFLWVISGIAVYLVYFTGYVQPPYHPSLLTVVQSPLLGILGFFTSLGTNLVHSVPFSFMAGMLTMVLFGTLLMVNRGEEILRRNASWVSLVLFSFFLSIEITVARSGFGLQSLIDMRYFLITFPGMIGLYCLSLNLISNKNQHMWISTIRKKRVNAGIFIVIFLLIVTGTTIHTIQGIGHGEEYRQSGQEYAYILQSYADQPDEILRVLSPNEPSILRRKASFLEEKRMSVFSGKPIKPLLLTPLEGRAEFRIDTINGKPVGDDPVRVESSNDTGIIIEGWAIDLPAGAPAGAVFIGLDGRMVPTVYSRRRPDVAAYFHRRGLIDTGFKMSISSDRIGEGTHHISVMIISHDGTGYYVSGTPFTIIVTGPGPGTEPLHLSPQ